MATRRNLIATTAIAPVIAATARLGQPAMAQEKKATFVLVPGQWTGAFIWHLVAPLLREAGHDVYAVTCTGLGERVHLANPAIDLDTHITDVINTIEFAGLHDVVLVGHSYGGIVITGVAERIPERLKMMVYLDADLPTNGQNYYDLWADPEVRKEQLIADVIGGVEAGTPGFRPVFPGVKEWVRGAVTDPDEAEWIISRLVPHPELSNLQPVQVSNPAAAALPHAFILCTADKDMAADPQMDSTVLAAERVRSDPNWTIIEMDANHVVALNDPEGAAETLLSLL